MSQRLNGTLQENLLALLCHDDVQGKIVSGLVDPGLFEGDYRVVAERAIDYWARFREAPKAHTIDLVSEIVEDPHNRRAATFRRIVTQVYQLATSVNAAYVVGEVRRFMRAQRLKSAILESAEKMNARQEMAIEEVEEIWGRILHAREVDFDRGMRLSEWPRMLSYIAAQDSEFVTGVKALDDNHIVPARGSSFLFLAPAGRGKTWFAVQVGMEALTRRMKVLHVAQESSEEYLARRCYQKIFAVPKREEAVELTSIEVDARDQISGFSREPVEPEWTLASPYVYDEVKARVEHMGVARFDDMVLKRFPMRTLTAARLRAYLDNLEVVDGFIPDLLVLENIGLMKTKSDNHRIDLGRNFEDVCGMCIDRNLALFASHQLSRAGAEALMSRSTQVAEDWSLIATAENVVTYSATDSEARLGLGRLFVNKARSERDHFTILVTQSYATGQFCVDSAEMPSNYFEMVKSMSGEDDSEGDDGGERDDE